MASENGERLILHCPNIIALCMDSYNAEQQNGRLYHQYTDALVEFSSLLEAFKQMDMLYDDIQFPYASTELKSFCVNRRSRRRTMRKDEDMLIMPEYERKDRKEMESFDDVIEQRGTDATFIIHVKHRQRSSWQGEVDGALNESEGKSL